MSEFPKGERLVDLVDYERINMTREQLEAIEDRYQSMKNAARSYDQFLRWCMDHDADFGLRGDDE